MEIEAVLRHVNEREGTTFRLVRRYETGEAGAYAVVDAAGRGAVLKWHPDVGHLAAVEAARAATGRLRAVGYPAPVYLCAVVMSDGTYALQETLPGVPLATVPHELLPRLLALNARQAGQGAGMPGDWPHPVTDPVLVGGNGFCLLEPLRDYSPATADLLHTAQTYAQAGVGGTFASGDLVHMDFNPANILVVDGDISGVVDWEGCCAGDCAFDLATLLFYAYEEEAVCEPLRRRILERAGPAALAMYLAHLIVRQVDWSIRHHDDATVARYVRIGQRIYADLGGLCGTPG